MAVITLLLLCVHGPDGAQKLQVETLRGKVITLKEKVDLPLELLKSYRITPDPEAGKEWRAFETDAGRRLPLIQDAGAMMFYRDPRLLNRPMQIQGRVIPGTSLTQVLMVHSLKDGQLHEVYYWCDVCAIRRQSLEKTNVCECCGGPMELREAPVKKEP
jgi:hypothetical protein